MVVKSSLSVFLMSLYHKMGGDARGNLRGEGFREGDLEGANITF
jgi:hypothetical protein